MQKLSLILILVVGLCTVSCRRHVVPKPYGYFRIAVPDTSYTYCHPKGYPYGFLLSDNAVLEEHPYDGEQYWVDIQYPMLNATIYCSYKPIRNNLRSLAHDTQEFLFSHSRVASAIPVQEFANPEHNMWGLYFELHGNTATPIQFILTDSVRHFFRAAVYANCVPNQDSLAPIYDYLREDVRVMMESMEWYETN